MAEPNLAEERSVALWRQLVARACRAGIRLEDAQDLASRTLTRAIEKFDPARGSFPAFCDTIHRNLMKNFYRDLKPTDDIELDSLELVDPDDPLGHFENEEALAMMRGLAEKILADLDPEEAAFFLALGDTLRGMETSAVSEAARRSGIAPPKGWDIFRRIQRKARKYAVDYNVVFEEPEFRPETLPSALDERLQRSAVDETSAPDIQAAPPPASPARGSADDLAGILLRAARFAEAGYDRFAASLSATQRARISAFLS